MAKAAAKPAPKTTNHSAKSGKFVTNAEVKKNPGTTVKVTNKKK